MKSKLLVGSLRAGVHDSRRRGETKLRRARLLTFSFFDYAQAHEKWLANTKAVSFFCPFLPFDLTAMTSCLGPSIEQELTQLQLASQ